MILAERWRTYARTQSDLARRTVVDDFAWGLEAGLDHLLDDACTEETAVARAIDTAARRDRHRARTRRIRALSGAASTSELGRLSARQELSVVRASTTIHDWDLLVARANGLSYVELAAAYDSSPGALRIRVLRLRRALADAIHREVDNDGSGEAHVA
jgi:hypothetical protein